MNDPILSAVIRADGKIIIGGDFTNYNGTERNHIAKVIWATFACIGNLTPQISLCIAPNPAGTALRITGLEGIYQWSILDAQGRLLLQGEQVHTEQTIDVSALAIGSYLLEVHDGKLRRSVRFSKR